MREQITAKVRQGLLPVLGGTTAPRLVLVPGTRRLTTCTYAASPCPTTPIPIKRRSQCWSVRWAWTRAMRRHGPSLGQRYYYDATYSNGGEEMGQRSTTALERALTLDPNLILGGRPTHGQPRGATTTSQGLSGRSEPGETASGKRPGPFHARLCSSLCRDVGSVRARMRCSVGSGSGKLAIPFLRVVVHAARQDWKGKGLSAPGRRLGVGHLHVAADIIAGRKSGRSPSPGADTCHPTPDIIAICWKLVWRTGRPELDRTRGLKRYGILQGKSIRSRSTIRQPSWRSAAGKRSRFVFAQEWLLAAIIVPTPPCNRIPCCPNFVTIRSSPALLAAAKQCQQKYLAGHN